MRSFLASLLCCFALVATVHAAPSGLDWLELMPPEDRQRDLRDNAVEARAAEIWACPDALHAAADELRLSVKACELICRIQQDIARATHDDLVRFAAEMIFSIGDAVVDAAADYVDSRAGDM